MDDETTTNAPDDQGGIQNINGVAIDDQGMAIPQPDVSEPAEAVEETPIETPAEGETEAIEPSAEQEAPVDDTSEWLKNKGIDPTDPEAINKLAKSAREAEKAMHRNAERRSELEKAAKITDDQIVPDATPEQRDNIRMRNLELRYDIQQWKLENQEKLAHEADMVKILSDPNKRLLVQEGLLTLDDVYSMARGTGSDESSIKSQGGQEALQKLAQKQQAAVPRGNAVTSGTTSSKITPQNVDAMVAKMSSEEYRRRLPEINRAMAG